MNKLQEYCCEKMKLCINDHRDPINYDSVLREYYIKTHLKYNILIFIYCPWCGRKLLKELRDEFFDVLENEYNIFTDIGNYRTNKNIPEEFKTDKWWKKRGL